MDQNELSLEPPHLGVPSGASKAIFKPMVHLAQTVHQSCLKISTISKRTVMSIHWIWKNLPAILHRHEHHLQMDRCKIPHDPWQLGVPSGGFKMISKPDGTLAQTVHYLASRLALSPNKPKTASTWASSPRSTIGVSKMICEPMVCLSQTMHLSYTDTNTVSKRDDARFHMTHVT
jgi:hypothetical protein